MFPFLLYHAPSTLSVFGLSLFAGRRVLWCKSHGFISIERAHKDVETKPSKSYLDSLLRRCFIASKWTNCTQLATPISYIQSWFLAYRLLHLESRVLYKFISLLLLHSVSLSSPVGKHPVRPAHCSVQRYRIVGLAWSLVSRFSGSLPRAHAAVTCQMRSCIYQGRRMWHFLYRLLPIRSLCDKGTS